MTVVRGGGNMIDVKGEIYTGLEGKYDQDEAENMRKGNGKYDWVKVEDEKSRGSNNEGEKTI